MHKEGGRCLQDFVIVYKLFHILIPALQEQRHQLFKSKNVAKLQQELNENKEKKGDYNETYSISDKWLHV